MIFVASFVAGGVICALAQLFMMVFKQPPPVVLVIFLVAGGFLSAFGLTDALSSWGSAGFTAMIVGCGQAVYETTCALLQGNPIPFAIVMGVYLFLVFAGSVAGSIRFRCNEAGLDERSSF